MSTTTKTVSRRDEDGNEYTGELVVYGEYRAIIEDDGGIYIYHPVAGSCAAWMEETKEKAVEEAVAYMKDVST